MLGGASKISVCFSGNTSVNSNLTPGQKESDQEILVCLTLKVNSTVLEKTTFMRRQVGFSVVY